MKVRVQTGHINGRRSRLAKILKLRNFENASQTTIHLFHHSPNQPLTLSAQNTPPKLFEKITDYLFDS